MAHLELLNFLQIWSFSKSLDLFRPRTRTENGDLKSIFMNKDLIITDEKNFIFKCIFSSNETRYIWSESFLIFLQLFPSQFLLFVSGNMKRIFSYDAKKNILLKSVEVMFVMFLLEVVSKADHREEEKRLFKLNGTFFCRHFHEGKTHISVWA